VIRPTLVLLKGGKEEAEITHRKEVTMWVFIPEAIYWVVLWIAGWFMAAQFITSSYWQYQVCC
jgi:hypothetical protein